MAVRVGRWDCPTCGNKMILGPETRCPNCGSSRPENVRFYLPTDAEIVEDEARLKEAKAGPDWICGYCTTQNKALVKDCSGCGNTRDHTSQEVRLEEREYNTREIPRDSFAPERTIHPLEQQAMQPPKKRRPFRWILLLGLIGLVGMLLLRSFPKEIEVSVVAFQWERQIQLQHNEPVQKEDWSVPNGAFEVSSFRAIRSYNQVLRGYETRTRDVRVKVGEERYVCGQIDKGNGYFVDKYCTRAIYETRQETYEQPVYDQVPVYDTKYRFKVMEWVNDRILKSSGKNQEAKWPNAPPQPDPQNWREGAKQELYQISVREDDGDLHLETIPFARWSKLKRGDKIKAKRSLLFDMYYGLQ
jgi:hypothetical protein